MLGLTSSSEPVVDDVGVGDAYATHDALDTPTKQYPGGDPTDLIKDQLEGEDVVCLMRHTLGAGSDPWHGHHQHPSEKLGNRWGLALTNPNPHPHPNPNLNLNLNPKPHPHCHHHLT